MAIVRGLHLVSLVLSLFVLLSHGDLKGMPQNALVANLIARHFSILSYSTFYHCTLSHPGRSADEVTVEQMVCLN